MRLSDRIRYEAVPERVFAMIVDPAFQEAKCVASGSLEHEIDISEHGDGAVTVISRRTLRTEGLPDFVRSFIGSTLRLHETQRWQAATADGSRTGTLLIQIEGAPVHFSGTVALAADGEGTQQPIEGEIRASVPLVGGRIEKAAAPAVLAGIRVEQRTGSAWLAEH